MKNNLAVILTLIIAGVLVAGCTLGQGSITTPVQTPVPVPLTGMPVQQPFSATGDHYLQRSYVFQSEKDVITEDVRVDSPSWSIRFTVVPLNENLQYCWFAMTVTNRETGQSETYGYGRENGFELTQQVPEYTTGSYQIVMKGNRVKVDLDIAKRHP